MSQELFVPGAAQPPIPPSECGKVLIVDDDEMNVAILEKLLEGTYTLATARSGPECLEQTESFRPDLVLLDIMMPGSDGYETCRHIKNGPLGPNTNVILVSAKASTKERLKGFDAGADDYIIKPFDHEELLAKVRIHMRLRGALSALAMAHDALRSHNVELETLVVERTHEVIATRDLTVFALAKLAESRDPETGQHLERMRSYCMILAQYLSHEGPYTHLIHDEFLEHLFRSAPLHDIGKVGIPDVILLKPGGLTTREFELMKQHAAIGAEALGEAAKHGQSGGFLTMAVEIARSHHERFDGSGYPDGLIGQQIPLPARIAALADVYDALTSVRVYKPAFTTEVARLMIEKEDGKHFDPAIVEAFRATYEEFLAVPRRIERHQPQTDHELVCI